MAFLWNPWNVLTSMHKERNKKMILSVRTPGVGMIKSLLVPNDSTSSTSFMDSVVILYRTLTNDYINVVKLFCRGVYKLCCYT